MDVYPQPNYDNIKRVETNVANKIAKNQCNRLRKRLQLRFGGYVVEQEAGREGGR